MDNFNQTCVGGNISVLQKCTQSDLSKIIKRQKLISKLFKLNDIDISYHNESDLIVKISCNIKIDKIGLIQKRLDKIKNLIPINKSCD